jgi:Mrp family chromosome partitioning ATPase
LLASQKIGDVVAQLAGLADIVIFDAPPIVTVNDASLLASNVDGVLLVVRSGGAKRDHVKAAKDRIEKVNARLVGAVLTNAQLDSSLEYS